MKLNSTCGNYAVNWYGKAYSMIRKLGSGVGLFVTCDVDSGCILQVNQGALDDLLDTRQYTTEMVRSIFSHLLTD